MQSWNKVLTSIVSFWLLTWSCEWISSNEDKILPLEAQKTEKLSQTNNVEEIPNIMEIKKKTKKEISICLKTDDENSFTYKKVLESIDNPENTTLEFPISQLFQTYWNHPHPLTVRWIKKDFRAILWKDWIENLSKDTPQKLSQRSEKITSDTQYETGDTLRFQLINPSLKWDFPKYLPDQLKEEWFNSFSDPNSIEISKKIKNKKLNMAEWTDKNSDFIYDIVVKKLSSWKSALALYRDWELYMTTYVSVWINHRRTKTWQFKTLWKNAYYYSRKYKSPMPYWVNFDEWWFRFHQWNVTWYPASHWCVRLPGLYASILFSSIKSNTPWDVFIDNNLYNLKK